MRLLIVCETMFTIRIGESRAISHANDTEQQAQQVAENPRRRRFSTETPLENADVNSSRVKKKTTTRNRDAERTSLSTAKTTSSTQPPQTCTDAAKKYYNYTAS